jgi:hypothetical protein
VVRLEDVADVAASEDVAVGFAQRREVDAAVRRGVEYDLPAVRGEDAGDQVQQGRLARAARADQRDLLGVAEVKVLDLDDRHDAAVGADVLLAELGERDCHRGSSRSIRAGCREVSRGGCGYFVISASGASSALAQIS